MDKLFDGVLKKALTGDAVQKAEKDFLNKAETKANSFVDSHMLPVEHRAAVAAMLVGTQMVTLMFQRGAPWSGLGGQFNILMLFPALYPVISKYLFSAIPQVRQALSLGGNVDASIVGTSGLCALVFYLLGVSPVPVTVAAFAVQKVLF